MAFAVATSSKATLPIPELGSTSPGRRPWTPRASNASYLNALCIVSNISSIRIVSPIVAGKTTMGRSMPLMRTVTLGADCGDTATARDQHVLLALALAGARAAARRAVEGGSAIFQWIGASYPVEERWRERNLWIRIGFTERLGRSIVARRASGGGGMDSLEEEARLGWSWIHWEPMWCWKETAGIGSPAWWPKSDEAMVRWSGCCSDSSYLPSYAIHEGGSPRRPRL